MAEARCDHSRIKLSLRGSEQGSKEYPFLHRPLTCVTYARFYSKLQSKSPFVSSFAKSEILQSPLKLYPPKSICPISKVNSFLFSSYFLFLFSSGKQKQKVIHFFLYKDPNWREREITTHRPKRNKNQSKRMEEIEEASRESGHVVCGSWIRRPRKVNWAIIAKAAKRRGSSASPALLNIFSFDPITTCLSSSPLVNSS